MSFIFVMQAHAASMNAGITINDGFKNSWTNKNPNLATAAQISFATKAANYTMSAATGDFYWNGTGTQPDYTINLSANNVGHIGGASSSLSIGNQTLDPATTGASFLTWYVNVPSTGGTDMLTFNLTSESILSQTSTNLTVNLLGYTTDANGHWSSSPSSLDLSVSQAGGTYSWTATWSATPEPASIVLLGLGLAVMCAAAYRRRA